MTALAGIAYGGGANGAKHDVQRMLAAQRIYGPHGDAHALSGPAAIGRALAHRLPEDRFDTGPISFADGRFTLVADCRIDNRDDLGTALGLGPKLAQMCDAAVIAAAFDRWGADCFDRLRGDFAVAVWDANERRFIVARDVFGLGALYLYHSAEMVAFSSMPQGLNALDALPKLPDADFIAHTMREFGMAGTGSYWQGMVRVEPGHVATLDFGGVTSREYWSRAVTPLILKDQREYGLAMREIIARSVSSRLRGETHVATHLSSGLDSSTVTGAVASLIGDGGRVTAFTSGLREGYEATFGKAIIDEVPLAAATAAKHPNVDHVIVRPTAEWSTKDVDKMFALAQAPITNICNLAWTNRINDAIKERGLKVLMPGGYGNLAMSYGGEHMLMEPLSRLDFKTVLRTMATTNAGPISLLKQIYFSFAWFWRPPLPFAGSKSLVRYGPGRDNEHTRLGNITVPPTYVDAIRATIARVDNGPLIKAQYAGWGIDVRDPTIDRDLFDFAASVPLPMFRKGGRGRELIRVAAADWVPPEVLLKTLAGYQAADWHEGASANRDWIREQVDAMRDSPMADELIDTDRLANLVDNWPSDDVSNDFWQQKDVTTDYRMALLRGISIGHFIRRASGSNR